LLQSLNLHNFFYFPTWTKNSIILYQNKEEIFLHEICEFKNF
jgi:hypothetical protein